MRLRFEMELTEAETAYLSKCANIRGISPSRLAYRLIRAIARDEMVLSILDDDSKRVPWVPGEPRERTPPDCVAAKNEAQAALRAIKRQTRTGRILAAGMNRPYYWGAK